MLFCNRTRHGFCWWWEQGGGDSRCRCPKRPPGGALGPRRGGWTGRRGAGMQAALCWGERAVRGAASARADGPDGVGWTPGMQGPGRAPSALRPPRHWPQVPLKALTPSRLLPGLIAAAQALFPSQLPSPLHSARLLPAGAARCLVTG